MGTKYTTQSISGYNSNPPPDDGTTGDDNKLTWAKHKTKLADPIKTLAEAVDTALVNMVDVKPLAKSGAYTTVADDDGRIIECTGTFTVTLGTSTTMGAGYTIAVKNISSGVITVATGETIDGSAANRTINENGIEVYTVNAAATGYLLQIPAYEFLDEDNMASNSASAVSSQQAIKAYVDTETAAVDANIALTNRTFGGSVSSAGSKTSTFGETWAVSRLSPGVYRITPGTGVSSAAQWVITATSDEGAVRAPAFYDNRTTTTFEINTRSMLGDALFDASFCFHCIVAD